MTPRRYACLLALATALALGVVWQSAALRGAAYRLEDLRARVTEQKAELALHRAHVSKLKNPRRILGLAEWLGLDLRERAVPPARAIVRRGAPPDSVAALADLSRSEPVVP
jgi:cell division protein FtsL